jgi:hypothetical protein
MAVERAVHLAMMSEKCEKGNDLFSCYVQMGLANALVSDGRIAEAKAAYESLLQWSVQRLAENDPESFKGAMSAYTTMHASCALQMSRLFNEWDSMGAEFLAIRAEVVKLLRDGLDSCRRCKNISPGLLHRKIAADLAALIVFTHEEANPLAGYAYPPTLFGTLVEAEEMLREVLPMPCADDDEMTANIAYDVWHQLYCVLKLDGRVTEAQVEMDLYAAMKTIHTSESATSHVMKRARVV